MSHLYGRFQVVEDIERLVDRLHVHDGSSTLREVDWEPLNGVLDQEDLLAQGIDVETFIPGAVKGTDGVGSCTANATMSALSRVLSQSDYLAYTKATSYDDVVGIERAAIVFYHRCTDQTGQPGTEWPPTDCGSSGPYVVEQLEADKLISGDQVAAGAQNIVSLMQTGGLLLGSPFLNAWEEPNSAGFIDGDGSLATLQRQIAGGVAGGHETYWSAIEKLVFDAHGQVDPFKTIVRGRNSWSKSWGDHGSYRAHLSTFVALGSYCDWRQLRPVT